jgi:hypothetical protein
MSHLLQKVIRNGYWSKWSYTNILIQFSHNLADVTISTVLVCVSSYIRPVEMGYYQVGVLHNDGDLSRYFTDKDTHPV